MTYKVVQHRFLPGDGHFQARVPKAYMGCYGRGRASAFKHPSITNDGAEPVTIARRYRKEEDICSRGLDVYFHGGSVIFIIIFFTS